jgi:hypothetical protein
VAEVGAGTADEGWTRKNMMTVKAILGRDSALAEAAFLHPIMMPCDGDESALLAIEFCWKGSWCDAAVSFYCIHGAECSRRGQSCAPQRLDPDAV